MITAATDGCLIEKSAVGTDTPTEPSRFVKNAITVDESILNTKHGASHLKPVAVPFLSVLKMPVSLILNTNRAITSVSKTVAAVTLMFAAISNDVEFARSLLSLK